MCAVLALTLGGCGILGCEEQQEVYELEYNWMGTGGPDPLEELGLKFARDGGWACNSDGSIRNAAGTVIGERYRCTKCD